MADQRMSDETRSKLMSLMPCASTGTYEWTPDAYMEKVGKEEEYIVPKDQWPVFTIRAMTTTEHAALRKTVLSRANFDKDKPQQIIDLSDMMHETVRKLVTDWRGIVDILSGDEYPYEADPGGGCLKEKWSRMPDTLKSEMFQNVCRMAGIVKMDGDDRVEMSKRGF